MKIKQITFRDDHNQDNDYVLGKYGVELIVEHRSQGEGDKWYYDVQLKNEVIRLFQFTKVIFDRE